MCQNLPVTDAMERELTAMVDRMEKSVGQFSVQKDPPRLLPLPLPPGRPVRRAAAGGGSAASAAR